MHHLHKFYAVFVFSFQDQHLLFVDSIFDDTLTPEMCHSILRELVDKKILKKHHIYLLINPVS